MLEFSERNISRVTVWLIFLVNYYEIFCNRFVLCSNSDSVR